MKLNLIWTRIASGWYVGRLPGHTTEKYHALRQNDGAWRLTRMSPLATDGDLKALVTGPTLNAIKLAADRREQSK